MVSSTYLQVGVFLIADGFIVAVSQAAPLLAHAWRGHALLRTG